MDGVLGCGIISYNMICIFHTYHTWALQNTSYYEYCAVVPLASCSDDLTFGLMGAGTFFITRTSYSYVCTIRSTAAAAAIWCSSSIILMFFQWKNDALPGRENATKFPVQISLSVIDDIRSYAFTTLWLGAQLPQPNPSSPSDHAWAKTIRRQSRTKWSSILRGCRVSSSSSTKSPLKTVKNRYYFAISNSPAINFKFDLRDWTRPKPP